MANEDGEGVSETYVSKTVMSFDFYSCEEAVKRLNDYLDRELDSDEHADVVKHLHICKPCLERFTFEETLLISIKTKMQSRSAPNELKSRLSALINNGR